MARTVIAASLALAAWTATIWAAPAIWTPSALAQSYPSKPIRLLVGFPAGGPSDVPARLIANKMQAALGQTVVVENKTGAAGMIALKEMLAQPRDGHTLLLCSYIDAINPLIYKKVDYKLDEIVTVSLVQKAYYAIAVPNALPANNLKEFIAHAKANPGKLNYGRVGTGSVTEVVPRQFEKLSGIAMTGVTFRGTGPALQEVVANRLDFMVGPISLTMPLLEGKQLKVIAMTSPERLPTAPNIPTMKEQGVPIVSEGWWGVCAASGTPAPVLEAINTQVVAAVNSPEFKTPIEKSGVIAGSTTLADAAKIWKATAADAEKLYKDIGFQRVD
jgi:tripartite-type tricarboxylate transporter receptor subunit TctC